MPPTLTWLPSSIPTSPDPISWSIWPALHLYSSPLSVQISYSSSISNTTCCPRLVSRCHTITDPFRSQKCIISMLPFFDPLSPYFAESPQHITSGFALFVYSSIPFLPSFLAFLSPTLFAFSLYLATSSYHPPDYFVTCVIMYIASSLLHRILFNEILMYNSRQLYAYHQHLSKYLITTLDWIWMAYHLCT